MSRNSDYATEKSHLRTVRQSGNAIGGLLALLVVLWAFDLKNAASMDLSPHKWKSRLLFIFAPDSRHPQLKQIQAEIRNKKADVEERDLVVFEVLEKGPSHVNGSLLSQEVADSLRERFEIKHHTYTLILVGKDGGVKLKRSERIFLREVFELIDSMPMRRDEMRQNNRQPSSHTSYDGVILSEAGGRTLAAGK